MIMKTNTLNQSCTLANMCRAYSEYLLGVTVMQRGADIVRRGY